MKRNVLPDFRISRSIVTALVIGSGVFYACSEEEAFVDEPASEIIESSTTIMVKDGRLAFDHQMSLEQFISDASDKDFINEYVPLISKYEGSEFTSLQPFFDEFNDLRIEAYRNAKMARLDLESVKNGRTGYDGDMDDEDELIADSYFASLLNDKREIQVGDMIYKYTDYGVFYTNAKSIDKLYSYLDTKKDSELASLPGGESREVAKEIFLFKQDYLSNVQDSHQYEETPSINGRTDNSSGFINGRTDGSPDPGTLGSCGRMNNNLITKVFGPAIECDDNFSSKKRIKVRAWNQNYLIYSSVGVKVKSQIKKALIWWESDADKLELGCNTITFGLPTPKVNYKPYFGPAYYYEYSHNGWLVDQYGQILSKNYIPNKLFSNFPVSKTSKDYLSVYIWNPLEQKDASGRRISEVFELTGKDLNNYTKQIFEGGVKAIWNAAKSRLEEKPAVIVEQTDNKIWVTVHNFKEVRTNTSRIERIFDFNILASVKFNPSAFVPSDLIPAPASVSYDVAKGSFYGMGFRDGIWKGKQVEWKEK